MDYFLQNSEFISFVEMRKKLTWGLEMAEGTYHRLILFWSTDALQA